MCTILSHNIGDGNVERSSNFDKKNFKRYDVTTMTSSGNVTSCHRSREHSVPLEHFPIGSQWDSHYLPYSFGDFRCLTRYTDIHD